MPLFSSSDLTRFWNQGESDVSSDKPFLVDRYSPTIVSGTASYTLSDYVISIRRITWLGWKLDPLPQRNFREVFQSAPQSSRPFWYIYNNVGSNKIQLFPTPNVNLAAGTNLWDTDIPNCVVVEYYRISDNSSFVLPSFTKRQLLKAYVATRSYSIDGPGSNQKLATYYYKKWGQLKFEFSELLDDLAGRPRKLVINEIVSSNYFPGEPVLPIQQFGISVDEGY